MVSGTRVTLVVIVVYFEQTSDPCMYIHVPGNGELVSQCFVMASVFATGGSVSILQILLSPKSRLVIAILSRYTSRGLRLLTRRVRVATMRTKRGELLLLLIPKTVQSLSMVRRSMHYYTRGRHNRVVAAVGSRKGEMSLDLLMRILRFFSSFLIFPERILLVRAERGHGTIFDESKEIKPFLP
jgi:hypothetical protein